MSYVILNREQWPYVIVKHSTTQHYFLHKLFLFYFPYLYRTFDVEILIQFTKHINEILNA